MTEIAIPVAQPGPNAVSSMPTSVFLPPSGEGPGIVLVQEIFGRTDYMRSRAADLAALGYLVWLPQVYWRLQADVVDETSEDGLNQAIALMMQADWEVAIDDIRSAVAALHRDPATGDRAALFGFCFGGGLAYAALQGAHGDEQADALVSYYGSALPTLLDGPAVGVPSLHHFGESDSYIPAETVEKIRQVVAHHEAVAFHTWPGADHAFDNPSPMFHHAQASEQAWQMTVEWLAEHYPA